MFFHVILDRKLNVSDTSDSSFMRYGLTFTIFNFLIPVKQHQGSAGAILAFIGLCAGLDANKIASMKFALSIVSEFFKTLITYYVGFMLLDVHN